MFFEKNCIVLYFVSKKSLFLQTDFSKRLKLFERVKSQADVAQLVEQLICNQPVGGSSPSIGSKREGTRAVKWGRL